MALYVCTIHTRAGLGSIQATSRAVELDQAADFKAAACIDSNPEGATYPRHEFVTLRERKLRRSHWEGAEPEKSNELASLVPKDQASAVLEGMVGYPCWPTFAGNSVLIFFMKFKPIVLGVVSSLKQISLSRFLVRLPMKLRSH